MQKMNLKLIALDIDGTLTDDEKKITPRTRACLLKAQEKGVRLETPVIVTNSAGASELVKTQQRHVNTGDNLIAII